MIKNLLYSLFIHFIFLLLVQLNTHKIYLNVDAKKAIEVGIELKHNVRIDSKKTDSKTLYAEKDMLMPNINNIIQKKNVILTKPEKFKTKEKIEKLIKSKNMALSKPKFKEKKEISKEIKESIITESKSMPSPKIVNDSKNKKSDLDIKKIDKESDIKKTEDTKEDDSSPTPLIENVEANDLIDDIVNQIFQGDYETLDINQLDNAGIIEESEKMYEISERDKINIRNTIKYCYRNAIKSTRQDSKVGVYAYISLAKNGYINVAEALIEPIKKGYSKDDYEVAKKNALKTLDFCNPLRNLPEDKYNIWRNMRLNFDIDTINN